MNSRILILVLIALLPSWLKIRLYRTLFGWQIGKNVRIGLSFIDAKKVTIEDNVRIGHLNRFHRIPVMFIGANTVIWNCNTFLSDPHVPEIRQSNPQLIIGSDSYIIGPHFFDVQAPLHIGRHVSFTGRGSITYTHSVDYRTNALVASPIQIGDHCCIGAGARFAPGSSVPSNSIVAMGAVVIGPLESGLIGGVPAKLIQKLSSAEYFQR